MATPGTTDLAWHPRRGTSRAWLAMALLLLVAQVLGQSTQPTAAWPAPAPITPRSSVDSQVEMVAGELQADLDAFSWQLPEAPVRSDLGLSGDVDGDDSADPDGVAPVGGYPVFAPSDAFQRHVASETRLSHRHLEAPPDPPPLLAP